MSITAAEYTRKLRDARTEVSIAIPPDVVTELQATPGHDSLAYRDTQTGIQLLRADTAHNLLPSRKLRNHEAALINVPKPVREALDVTAGDHLTFTYDNHAIHLEPATK